MWYIKNNMLEKVEILMGYIESVVIKLYEKEGCCMVLFFCDICIVFCVNFVVDVIEFF